MSSPIHVLIVEDDPSLIELLRYNLEDAGFVAAVETDGEAALVAIAQRKPDIMILDWMIPSLSGIDICRRVRAKPETANLPIIMLTARDEETDKIMGLEAGADDYMAKPFSPKELIARVRALLRRTQPAQSETLSFGNVEMDTHSHSVSRAGVALHLGPTEYRLLRILLEKPGRVFSREQLLNRAWDQNIHVEIRTVDVHIRRLRKNLNADGQPDIIRTVRSAGYALDLNAAPEAR